jgi:hypothetical protein
MENVDFSNAKLIGITFSNRIDLSKCKFPQNENYLFISDLKKTISTAIEKINSDWSDNYERETAINIIKYVHYTLDKQDQKNDFIDLYLAKEMSDSDSGVGLKLFDLFRTLQ